MESKISSKNETRPIVGKISRYIQNIIWRITREGATWVAINETMNRFNQERRKGLDE